MDEGHRPKPAYASLIGRWLIGSSIREAEVDRLPDPDAFRDAMFLSQYGSWSGATLDQTDAIVLALVRMFQSPVRKG